MIDVVPCELCPLGEIRADQADDFFCYGCRSYICAAHPVDPEDDHAPMDHDVSESEADHD